MIRRVSPESRIRIGKILKESTTSGGHAAATLGRTSLLAVTMETALEAANPAKTSRLDIRVIPFFRFLSFGECS
jgi:hypothetical protein